MSNDSFDVVWDKIISNEGNKFHTVTNLEFTYRINNNILIPSRTEYNISRNNIKKAFDLLPVSGPGDISNVVQGSSYVWAILNDKRIS